MAQEADGSLAAAKARDEAVEQAARAQAQAAAAEKDRAGAKGQGVTRTVSLRTTRRSEVTDRRALLNHVARVAADDLDVFLAEWAAREVRAGRRELPGVGPGDGQQVARLRRHRPRAGRPGRMIAASIVLTINHAHLARVMDARRRAGLPASLGRPAPATALPQQGDVEAVTLPNLPGRPPMTPSLADRVEAAGGADREIERALILEAWLACFPAPESGWRRGVGFNDAWHAWNRRKAKVTHWLAAGASLDAAMSLVPEGWRLRQAKFSAPCADDRKWHLNLHGGREGEDTFAGRGATPALALTAACLRAIAHAGEAIGAGSSEIAGRAQRGGGA